jgi:tetratricopeptide (TPR) repeat protein
MRYKDALDKANSLITSSPDDATLYLVRADIERESGHSDLALLDLDNAIKLDDTLSDAYILRGDIYLTQGKKQLAKGDFEKAMSLGVPTSQLHDRMLLLK